MMHQEMESLLLPARLSGGPGERKPSGKHEDFNSGSCNKHARCLENNTTTVLCGSVSKHLEPLLGLQPPETKSYSFPARTPRSGGRAGPHFPMHVYIFNDFGDFVFGRYPIFSGMKFDVECNQNHVWDPLGPEL